MISPMMRPIRYVVASALLLNCLSSGKGILS